LTLACLLLILLGVVASSGCLPPPKKRRFNNMIARANTQLKEKADGFNKIVSPLRQGQAVNAGEARSALNAFESTLKDTKKQFNRLSSPVQSPKGETLLSKYRDFLKTEEDIVSQCLRPIVTAIEDNGNYPTPAAKWSVVSGLLDKANSMERDAFTDVATAQKEYAEAHKYKLVKP
jgi:hypothetical protein